MSEANHDLATEFPEMKEIIHALKIGNEHFKNLSEKYYQLNKQIHRAEQRVEMMSELEEEKLRKERLAIKDQLFTMLQKAK